MSKSIIETINEMVNRINMSGCRVSVPFKEPSPLKILFDGEFSNAAYIPSYPAALHIFGMPGQIAVSDLLGIEQTGHTSYVVRYGRDASCSDMLVKITE